MTSPRHVCPPAGFVTASSPLAEEVNLNSLPGNGVSRGFYLSRFGRLLLRRFKGLLPLLLDILDHGIGSLEMLLTTITGNGRSQSEHLACPLHTGFRNLAAQAPMATLGRVNTHYLALLGVATKLPIGNP